MAEEKRKAKAQLIRGEGSPATFEFEAQATMGRLPSNEIPVRDPKSSRRHAYIRLERDGNFYLKDLGSRNGTQVNGKAVSRCRLSNGDLIQIGAAVYRFEAADTPAPSSEKRPAISSKQKREIRRAERRGKSQLKEEKVVAAARLGASGRRPAGALSPSWVPALRWLLLIGLFVLFFLLALYLGQSAVKSIR